METGIITGVILYLYFDVIHIPHYIKRLFRIRKVKLFGCELCLSFWTAITITIINNYKLVNFFDFSYIASVIFVTSYTVIKLLRG